CRMNEINIEVLRRYLRITAARDELRRKKHREPTVAELAAAVGARQSTVWATLAWVEKRKVIPLYQPRPGTDTVDGHRMEDVIPSDENVELERLSSVEVECWLRPFSNVQRYLVFEHVIKERPIGEVARE